MGKKGQICLTAERCGSSSSVVFQNYKFNFATENSEQLLSVFVTGSVVMTVILNTTFVLWLTAQSVHCTLLQPGCTKIFNGLDLIQFSVANGTAGDQLHLPFSSAVYTQLSRDPREGSGDGSGSIAALHE